jgi:hypothetical protein
MVHVNGLVNILKIGAKTIIRNDGKQFDLRYIENR